MKIQYSFTGLFFFYFLFTCSVSFAQSDQYKIVLVDSIMIESLEQVQITDYSPSKNRFLAYGTKTKVCMEVDDRGNILSKVDLNGEGPGHFGPGITELGYLGDDIIINGPNVYFTYDGNWNYKQRIVYESGGAWLPIGMISGAPEVAIYNKQAQIIKPIDHTYFGSVKLPNDYFSSASLIEAISVSDGNTSNELKYPKESIYQSQSIFYDSHRAKVDYNSTKDRLYLSLPLEPKIYVINTHDFSINEVMNIDLKGFKQPQGIPFEDQHKNGRTGFGRSNQLNTIYNYTNSAIHRISSEGDITMVEYQTGTKGKTSLKDINQATELAKKESKTLTAFFKGKDKIAEVEERFLRFVRLDEYRFLMHEVNTEEELDYSLFYIYELRKTN